MNTVIRMLCAVSRPLYRWRLLHLAIMLTVGISPLMCLLEAQHASASAPAIVEGTVYNFTNGLPVGRAKVGIKGTDMETLTDDEGRFIFSRVPAGEIQLQVLYLGFDSQTITLSAVSGQTTVHDFQLVREGSAQAKAGDEDVVLLEKYQVVADQAMSAQALAMNEQRHAANIRTVIAFEELGDFGHENIGDYIRFLPGVAIVDDGENPGALALGGFPAEMSNIQLDGGSLASTGIGSESSRTLTLQEVPMVNIERIEVSKVPTPDMPASSLGGMVNLVTKSLLGTKRAYLTYQLYMNFDNIDGISTDGGGSQPVPRLSPRNKKPSYGISLVVPLSKRLVFSAGASRTWRQRPADNTPTEQALWNLLRFTKPANPDDPPQPKDIALATAQWSQIAEITSTENIQAGVEWKIARNDTLAFTVQYRETSTEKATSRLTTRFHSSNEYDPIGDGTYTSARPGRGVIEMGGNTVLNFDSMTEKTHMTLRYNHRGERWRIDGSAVYSHSERERSNLDKGYFAGYYASVTGLDMQGDGIDTGDSILPTSYTITTTAGAAVDPYDGDSYVLNSVRDEWGLYKTDMYEGRVNVERIFNRNSSIKAGGSFNRLEKDDRRTPITYSFLGDGRGRNIALYDVIDKNISVLVNGTEVRWISPVKLYDLFLEHPEYFSQNATTIQYQAENSKKMIEDISAGYLRFDLRLFNNRLNIISGVRYEKTMLDGWSMRKDLSAIYVKDENGNRIKDANDDYLLVTTDPIEQYHLMYKERAFHESQTYDGLYPSVNINYVIAENLVARAAYARTIGRPDVKYVVAGISAPDPDETDPDLARTITVGNPGLEPWTANSFHLSLDSYHLKGGFGSVGIYRKNVTNFFAERSLLATAEELQRYGLAENDIIYMLEQGYMLRRWENIGDAHLTGLELSYRQDLFFLPAWLQKMQVWVNYMHLKVGGTKAEDFTGFTPDALSCGINYFGRRLSIRLSCAHQAETKKSKAANAPGTAAANYIPDNTYNYQASYTRYGIKAEYSFSKTFSVYLNWDNIFGEGLYVYRRASDTPEYAWNYQRYVTPSYIMLGVKGRF